MAAYELTLTDDRGVGLAELPKTFGFAYSRVSHAVGVLVVTLPSDFSWDLLLPDRMVQVWREAPGMRQNLERTYFLRKRRRFQDRDGDRFIQATGFCPNYLLTKGIVAYAAGSAEATKTAEVDDMMKAIVAENIGASATDTDRRLNASYFSVQADLTLGPSVTRSFARGNLLSVLQDLAETSREAGTAIYWDVVCVEPNVFQFQTFASQPGRDHTYPNGTNPVILSVEAGNLAQPDLEEDYSEEVTVTYAGGQGEGTAREVVESEDTTRTGRSIWGRREAWVDARNESTTAGVTAAGQARLVKGQPRIRFTGRIVDNAQTRYGVHWRQGDRVTAEHEGQSYDPVIRGVKISINDKGLETIDAGLEVES